MSLYSFRHSKICPTEAGKTFARLAYICRNEAIIMGERHQLKEFDRATLRTFARSRESLAGKNGRVAECFIAALPVEGTPELHRTLVSHFAERLTKNEAPWIAALHYDKPGNPHVHLMAFDQSKDCQPTRGRPAKIIGLSRHGALEEVRALWAECHNTVMAAVAPPIDHRSLVKQGKPHLLPMVHEGPALRAIKKKGSPPATRPKPGRWVDVVDWTSIDYGRDRIEMNRQIAHLNHLTTTYTETQHGRPDRVLAALAGADGPKSFLGSISMADGSGYGEANDGTARSHQDPACRGDETAIGGGGESIASNLSARLAAFLGMGGGRTVGRSCPWRFRRGVASVGRYAPVRLGNFETAVRRLIAETGTVLSRSLSAFLGIAMDVPEPAAPANPTTTRTRSIRPPLER